MIIAICVGRVQSQPEFFTSARSNLAAERTHTQTDDRLGSLNRSLNARTQLPPLSPHRRARGRPRAFGHVASAARARRAPRRGDDAGGGSASPPARAAAGTDIGSREASFQTGSGARPAEAGRLNTAAEAGLQLYACARATRAILAAQCAPSAQLGAPPTPPRPPPQGSTTRSRPGRGGHPTGGRRCPSSGSSAPSRSRRTPSTPTPSRARPRLSLWGPLLGQMPSRSPARSSGARSSRGASARRASTRSTRW